MGTWSEKRGNWGECGQIYFIHVQNVMEFIILHNEYILIIK